jgi:acyl-coenzyme A thioesterase PaaI-like protein
MPETESFIFQDYMPGNVCFGCGKENHKGLHIQSYWEGEDSVCVWTSEMRYQGWVKIMNGGILATLIDCHCMGTAMAAAYREEGRSLDSEPYYRYATASIKVDYLKPTPNDQPVTLRAQVIEIKGRKTSLTCQAYSDGEKTAQAEVVAVRVFEGIEEDSNPFR